MATRERTEQSLVVSQRLLALKYGAPVIAPVITSTIFRTLFRPFAEKIDYPFKPDVIGEKSISKQLKQESKEESFADQISRDAFNDKNYADRLNKISSDVFNYVAIGGANMYMAHLRKREFLETFKDLVADELNIANPDDVTFKDLGKSQNFLVQSTLRRLNRSLRFSWLKDIPYLLGAAIPFLSDLNIFRDYKQKQDALVDQLGEYIQQDVAKEENSQLEFLLGIDSVEEFAGKHKKIEKKFGEGSYEPLLAKWTELQESGKWQEFKDAAAKVEDLNQHAAAGVGTPVALMASAIYLVSESLGSGNDTFLEIRKLKENIERAKSEDETAITLINIYNGFYEDYREQYPDVVKAEETRRNREPAVEAPQTFVERVGGFAKAAWKQVSTLFGLLDRYEPSVPFAITPLSMDDRLDPRMRSVFQYMGEQVHRTQNLGSEIQSKDTLFTPEVFMRLVGEGWIAVDNSKVTQFVARITAQLGMQGFDVIEARLQQERQHNGVEKLNPDQLIITLEGLYKDVVRSQLQQGIEKKTAPLAQNVVLNVTLNSGEVQRFELDAQRAAELMGANRLKNHYLNLDNMVKTMKHPPSQLLTEVDIGEVKFIELRDKVRDKIREESDERYILMDPDKDKEKIAEYYTVWEKLRNPLPAPGAEGKGERAAELLADAPGADKNAEHANEVQPAPGEKKKLSKKQLRRRCEALEEQVELLKGIIHEQQAGTSGAVDKNIQAKLDKVLAQQDQLMEQLGQEHTKAQTGMREAEALKLASDEAWSALQPQDPNKVH